jgi:hypothetical protein
VIVLAIIGYAVMQRNKPKMATGAANDMAPPPAE